MRCISPLLIDPQGTRAVVPCGKCGACLHTRRCDWSFRLAIEHRQSVSSYFVTLTYDDLHLPWDEVSVSKRDLQLFVKRLRKANSVAIRYYAVAEYGTLFQRPHYHLLLFNLDPNADLLKIWPYGRVDVGTVTPASIHYVTKYHVNKGDELGGRAPPFVVMSRRPGIGASYKDSHRRYHRSGMRYTAKLEGRDVRLPRYYKDAFFTVVEKPMLAAKAIELSDEQYVAELQRLLDLGYDNPAVEYDYREAYAATNYRAKSNVLNKF